MFSPNSNFSGTFIAFARLFPIALASVAVGQVTLGCGDFDNDGDIDLADHEVFAQCLAGLSVPPAATCSIGVNADCDGDGDVDLADSASFNQNLAYEQLCRAPSDPPPNPPESGLLNYSCNGTRNPGSVPPALTEFVAYHTRLPDADLAVDPRQEATHPISGDLADVIVNLPGRGRLEFPRRTSYRLVWVTTNGIASLLPELVTRAGDGSGQRPDRINRYSYARVVRTDATEIVVHWRYVPDFCDPTPTGVVHELFTIRPNGTVTRTVHISASTLEGAADCTNNLRQELTLGASGVTAPTPTSITRTLPDIKPPASITAHPVANPLLDFPLDDGSAGRARTAREAVSGTDGAVNGRYPSWHPGVSGTALSLDGYTSEVSYPAARTPAINGSFTLEAWVALAAYPFGTAQLVGQASVNGNNSFSPDEVEGGAGIFEFFDDEADRPITFPFTVGGTGYMLAIDALGQPNLLGNFGGTWTAAVGSRLTLHEWYHLSGVYDASNNTLRLYVNGAEVASTPVTGSLQLAASKDFVIGRNREPQWIVAGSEMHVEAFKDSIFGIESLVDEIRLYDRALSVSEVAQAASRFGTINTPVLPQRVLPDASGTGFAAQQKTLSYHAAWDQLFHDSGFDDVVVSYDSLPTSVVFWKGMSYGPAWVSSNGIWAHDQSMEWGDVHGLVEHMGDKQVRYAHARVVEDTDARIVVHWRYAPVAVTYRLYELAGDLAWVDEYYTMYPDGTTVRYVDDFFCREEGGAPGVWQSTYIMTPPGAEWTDLYNEVVASVLAADGTRGDLNVVEETLASNFLANAVMIWTNTRSNYRLYRGVTEGVPLVYGEDLVEEWEAFVPQTPEDLPYSTSPLIRGNHWPVAQLPNDGRTALYNDRISHSEGLADLDPTTNPGKVMLYGFSQTPAAALPMVNGWNQAPPVTSSSLTSDGYNRREHAYQFQGTGSTLTFTISGSQSIRNPGVVVRGWTGSPTPTVTVNASPVSARTGIHYNGGERTLIVWAPFESNVATININ